jgi:hypothetical protein
MLVKSHRNQSPGALILFQVFFRYFVFVASFVLQTTLVNSVFGLFSFNVDVAPMTKEMCGMKEISLGTLTRNKAEKRGEKYESQDRLCCF